MLVSRKAVTMCTVYLQNVLQAHASYKACICLLSSVLTSRGVNRAAVWRRELLHGVYNVLLTSRRHPVNNTHTPG